VQQHVQEAGAKGASCLIESSGNLVVWKFSCLAPVVGQGRLAIVVWQGLRPHRPQPKFPARKRMHPRILFVLFLLLLTFIDQAAPCLATVWSYGVSMVTSLTTTNENNNNNNNNNG